MGREKTVPTVVPAECIVYFKPLAFNTRCTSATSAATEMVPVPTYSQDILELDSIFVEIMWFFSLFPYAARLGVAERVALYQCQTYRDEAKVSVASRRCRNRLVVHPASCRSCRR